MAVRRSKGKKRKQSKTARARTLRRIGLIWSPVTQSYLHTWPTSRPIAKRTVINTVPSNKLNSYLKRFEGDCANPDCNKPVGHRGQCGKRKTKR